MLRPRNGTVIRCGLGGYRAPLGLKSKLKHGPLLARDNNPPISSGPPTPHRKATPMAAFSAAALWLTGFSKFRAKNSQIQAAAHSLPTSGAHLTATMRVIVNPPRVSSTSQHSGFFTGGEDLSQVSLDPRRREVWNWF